VLPSLNALARALQTGEALSLKQLGVVVQETDAMKERAKTMAENTELTIKATKKIVLLEEATKRITEKAGAQGDVISKTGEKIGQAVTEWENFTDTLQRQIALDPAIQDLFQGLIDLLRELSPAVLAIVQALSSLIDIGKELKSVYDDVIDTLGPIGDIISKGVNTFNPIEGAKRFGGIVEDVTDFLGIGDDRPDVARPQY
jgi:phage-related protein